MKAKTIIISTVAVAVLFSSVQAFGKKDDVIKLIVNGKPIQAQGKLIDERVYVPVRAVSEALGADVTWDGNNSTVHVNTFENRDEIIPEVVKKVSPSVVGIIGNSKGSRSSSYGRSSDQIVHGTGVIVKADGHILTNAHVVSGMDKIVVVLADGSGYQAEIKSMDEESDLALIKIAKTGLQPAKFADEEDIIIGKTVIAIGTPISFSLRNSASIGIISGVNRGINSSYRLIQTDAAINPGNSGGPLVNLKGEVVGINSSKYAGPGIEGMGFSIPVNTVEYVLSHFEKYGEVKRPVLGATFEEDWAARVGLPAESGLTISSVEKGSAAAEAGLKKGDILLSINDKKVNSIVDFNEEMKKYMPQNRVTVKIKREGIMQNISVTLGAKK